MVEATKGLMSCPVSIVIRYQIKTGRFDLCMSVIRAPINNWLRIYAVGKKMRLKSLDVDIFSKFFRCHTLREMCDKLIITDSIAA